MRDHRPNDIENLLAGSQFAQLQEQSRLISAIREHLSEILPNIQSENYHVASYRHGTLVLECISPTRATVLKRFRDEIRSGLRRRCIPALSHIEFKINPRLSSQSSTAIQLPKKTKDKMSIHTASNLISIAQHLPENLKLRLESIAALAEGKSED